MRPLALGLCLFLGACGWIKGYLPGPSEELPPLAAFEPTLKVNLLWKVKVGEGMDEPFLKLTPAVEDGRVFAADRKGQAEALDAGTGKRLWKSRVPVPISGGVGSGEGKLLVASPEGDVVALDAENGSLLWRASTSSEILSPPRIAQGVVVVHTVDGQVLALDALDGHVLWRYQSTVPVLTLRGTSPPLLVEGKVVVGLANGRLACFALRTGHKLWEVAIAVPHGRTEVERIVDIDGELAFREGVVYAVSYQGKAAAVALETGEVLWSRKMSSYAGLVADSERVYVSDADGIVWALERHSGAPLWRQEGLRRRHLTAPSIHGRSVVVGDGEGYLHWLSPEDGHFLARRHLDGKGIYAPMAVADGVLYVYGRSGALAALEILD